MLLNDGLAAQVYDCHTLLFIRDSTATYGASKPWFSVPQSSSPPQVLAGKPRCTWQHKSSIKYRRRRGRRAGIQVKLRQLWRRGVVRKRRRSLLLSCGLVLPVVPWDVFHGNIRFSFLRPVFPDSAGELIAPPPVSCLCGGANPRHLHTLPRVSPGDMRDVTILKVALLNARSIANKSFVLHDLILSKNLDFLFLTETWQRNMDHSPLIELCPKGYTFLARLESQDEAEDLLLCSGAASYTSW